MTIESMAVHEIAAKVKSRELKATEVAEAFLKRAQKLNSKLNAFVTFNDEVLAEAKQIDSRLDQKLDVGPLAGVPIGIKDLLCTKGLKTTAASKMLHNFVPPYSATVVEKLKSSGAIILGKTNLDEFAMGSSNENSIYGNVKNPWSLERVPGGSSGGSAVAVAALMAPACIGTDTGGSIRQPASYCNVVGLKPTYGRVSRYGIIAFASSLDQAGPMATNVADTALILESISGQDDRDSTTSEKGVPKYFENLREQVSGLTIGKPREYFDSSVHPEIAAAVEHSCVVLKSAGAKIVDVSIPSVKYAISMYYLIAGSEASSNLARYDGIRFGYRTPEAKDIHELFEKSRGEGFGPEVKRRIMLGTHALSSGYYDAYYIKACKARRLLQKDFLAAFEKCDILLSPVTPMPPFKIGEQINDPLAMYLSDILTISTNLAGLPGMSVPAGFTRDGLPIGVQLTGRPFDEQTLLNTAQTLESNLDFEKRTPNV